MGSKKQEALHEFFAVTATSVYRVTDKFDPSTHEPIVEKIALKGESGIRTGERLRGGNVVGITGRFGLVMYLEDFSPYASHPRTQRLEEVNTAYWGSHTSWITGFFLKKEKALRCLDAKTKKGILCDPRWEKETLEVLGRIGDDHSVFILSKDPDICLPVLLSSGFFEKHAKTASR